MNRSTIDLWVGIFVAVGFGAILFLALKVGNLITLDRTPGYHLEASFDNIGGLKLRAPVKAAGVVVGRVEAVREVRIDRGQEHGPRLVHDEGPRHRQLPRLIAVERGQVRTHLQVGAA